MNRIYFETKGEQLLERQGITKAEFARRMGIQRQNVKALFKSNDLRVIRKAADVLDVPLSFLFGYVEPVDFNELPFAEVMPPTEPEESEMVISPEDVPTGDSTEERRERQRIIREFYKRWLSVHPESYAYNKSLNDNIFVQYISIHETAGQASLKYLSTLAVLQLDSVLRNAILLGESKPKRTTKSQKVFEKMLIMTCSLPGIGRVKMMVGVKRADGTKVQYCVTAVTPDK